jgi:hypothetical protein
MNRHGSWWRLTARVLVAVWLLSGSGCLCYLHPLGMPDPVAAAPCRAVPKCARDHVYVFIIHGMDPFDYANLTGLRDFIQGLGFNKTYYGQLYHPVHFDHEIYRIHQEDPDARIVLIGFSFGANMVRYIAQDLKAKDIHVDLLVYFGGNTLKDNDYDQPPNVGRILNILATGFIWNGSTMERAENVQVQGVWHFGSPTHEESVKLLTRELAAVAASVPVTLPPDLAPEPETAPTPRPVTAEAKASDPEWSFLRPVSRLKEETLDADPAKGRGLKAGDTELPSR